MKKLLEIEWYVLLRPLSNIQQITDFSSSFLKNFINEHFYNPEIFRKARSEVF